MIELRGMRVEPRWDVFKKLALAALALALIILTGLITDLAFGFVYGYHTDRTPQVVVWLINGIHVLVSAFVAGFVGFVVFHSLFTVERRSETDEKQGERDD